MDPVKGNIIMKKTITALLAAAIIFVVPLLFVVSADASQADVIATLKKEIDASPDASADLKTFAKDKLIPLCTNPVFVKAVTEQNAKGISLDEIKKIDEEWQAAEEFLPIHEELTTNACAKEINHITASLSKLTEVFVMDNQGANVGQNEITSDYWQGDEPKWTHSYNDGKGGVDISKPKLDKSTNRTDQKVSLPIIDTSGKVIGAICIGVIM